MDLIRVQEGIVEIFGKPWKNNEKSIKCRIGYIPDSNFLPEHLTPIFIEKIMKSFLIPKSRKLISL
jgi:ABC-type multidrug transport system ATPase subunit